MITPCYHQTGPHEILHWHEYNQGSNILVARSLLSLERAFASVSRAMPNLKVKARYSGIVVPPPEWMIREHYRQCRIQDIEQFRYFVEQQAADYLKIRKHLPVELAKCPGYQPAEGEKPDDRARHAHHTCLNCGGIKLILVNSMTWEQYYDAHHETQDSFRVDYPAPAHNTKSETPATNDNVPIYVFRNGWHGIEIVKIFPTDSYTSYASWSSVTLLLQGEICDVPGGNISQILETQRAFNERQKREKEIEEARSLAVHREKLKNATLDFFERPTWRARLLQVLKERT